jgi:hypothetical protein
MNISTVKVKEYNSTNKHILIVEGNPVCIVRGNKSLNDCISYLMNREPSLKDGRIKKILDKVRAE